MKKLTQALRPMGAGAHTLVLGSRVFFACSTFVNGY
jgi:hypothetical protein